MADLAKDRVPDNVKIKEFFFQPGSRLGNFHAQYHYVSSNYTHAARDVFLNGCNVVMQMLACRESDSGVQLSMSCNPDTSAELHRLLRESEQPFMTVAVVNDQLPYMCGDAEVATGDFDILVRGEVHSHTLFALPKLPPVGAADYLLGLNASCLVRDGGTLQIGIGTLGDAVAYALNFRQEDNASYTDALIHSGILTPENRGMVKTVGGTASFHKGLYGATEMFVEGFLHLLDTGVLRRQVYDFWALQQLINTGRCDPCHLDIDVLVGMAELGVREIRGKDFNILQHHGLFNDDCSYQNGYISAPDGSRIAANVVDPHSRRVMATQCMGAALKNGQLLHAGFFLGSSDFYEKLRRLPEGLRRKINMTGVNKINQLDLNPRLYRAQRIHARFINTGLKATLNGAVVSDTLQSGQVLSGVGGQYNFVAMAHQLLTGRSILMIRAVRENQNHLESNIVWEYGSCTIPRHLRDIVITEYGIADLRGKSDGEVIKAMLNIADSRFQSNLLTHAISLGKIEEGYQIPARFSDNIPRRVRQIFEKMSKDGNFPAYPFGCDFNDEELKVGAALKRLSEGRERSILRMLAMLLKPVGQLPPAVSAWLNTLGLSNPQTLRDRILQRLLSHELKKAFTEH
ncbi:MAG: acyl-CoA hydrolase [Bermanella sp.]|jgi:acyl-CoA hydrolase